MAARCLRVFHRKVQEWAFVRCSAEFMQELEQRRHLQKSGHLIEYEGRPVKDIGTAFSNAAVRAGLEYDVCPYDIRHLWITTMLDKRVELSAIAYLAGTSPRMIIKNSYEPHAKETEKAAELLPKLGAARGAPLRLAVRFSSPAKRSAKMECGKEKGLANRYASP